jgi:hypothetical protein
LNCNPGGESYERIQGEMDGFEESKETYASQNKKLSYKLILPMKSTSEL